LNSSLLGLAVKSRIPLITVTTEDAIHGIDTLTRVIDEAPKGLPKTGTPLKNKAYVTVGLTPANAADEYKRFREKQSSLIVLNPKGDLPQALDCGMLETPVEMVREFVRDQGGATPENVEPIVQALRGLTFKDVEIISRLSMVQYGEYTPKAVRSTRITYKGPSQGIQSINTEVEFYHAPAEITEWVNLDGKLFNTDAPDFMQPRGLLFGGPPGTGKTLGAKYIAQKLQIPLYAVNVAELLNKYVGESNSNLANIFKFVSMNSPCVLLLDEVEKLFQAESDAPVTQQLLAQLLWWMQEHNDRVLTIMTTNNAKSLPPELYRAGRIDSVIDFKLFTKAEATAFMQQRLKALGVGYAGFGNALYEDISAAEVDALAIKLAKEAWLRDNP